MRFDELYMRGRNRIEENRREQKRREQSGGEESKIDDATECKKIKQQLEEKITEQRIVNSEGSMKSASVKTKHQNLGDEISVRQQSQEH